MRSEISPRPLRSAMRKPAASATSSSPAMATGSDVLPQGINCRKRTTQAADRQEDDQTVSAKKTPTPVKKRIASVTASPGPKTSAKDVAKTTSTAQVTLNTVLPPVPEPKIPKKISILAQLGACSTKGNTTTTTTTAASSTLLNVIPPTASSNPNEATKSPAKSVSKVFCPRPVPPLPWKRNQTPPPTTTTAKEKTLDNVGNQRPMLRTVKAEPVDDVVVPPPAVPVAVVVPPAPVPVAVPVAIPVAVPVAAAPLAEEQDENRPIVAPSLPVAMANESEEDMRAKVASLQKRLAKALEARRVQIAATAKVRGENAHLVRQLAALEGSNAKVLEHACRLSMENMELREQLKRHMDTRDNN
ncbi:unnamed protein product, partial [Mesorhabditis spiculigera]